MLLPQNSKEADRGVPGQGVLQAAVDGPHPQDEASGRVDSYQQQRFRPHSTGLLSQEKEESLSIQTVGVGPPVWNVSNLKLSFSP